MEPTVPRKIIAESDTPKKARQRDAQARHRAKQTPEDIAICKAHGKDYAALNRDRITEKMREWRDQNREHHQDYRREYRNRPEVKDRRRALRMAIAAAKKAAMPPKIKKAIPAEEMRDRQRCYRARWEAKLTPEGKAYQSARARAKDAARRCAEGKYTAVDLRRIFAAQRGKCAACHCSIKKEYHVDHIIALACGGTNWPRNIQLLCPLCNLRKKAKDPIVFMQSLGRLL